MSTLNPIVSVLKNTFPVSAFAIAAATFSNSVSAADDAQIIELTQVNCQFVESENGTNHGFKSAQKSDCEAIHEQSGAERLAASKVMELKPGKYIFRVKNENVEYPLGFYLRGESLLDKARLPKVSGGGLELGVTKDYEIELKEGEYVYSCPLNSTLDYKLVVLGS